MCIRDSTYSDKIVLVADAVKGDAATVNSWVAETKANDSELVFAGEGLFSITSILDPAKMQFSYDDFEFVENLYSSVFVMSADAKLGITSIDELKSYMDQDVYKRQDHLFDLIEHPDPFHCLICGCFLQLLFGKVLFQNG